jgi:hypothetical protein
MIVEWWFPRGGRGRNGELLFNEYRVSVSKHEKSYGDRWQ